MISNETLIDADGAGAQYWRDLWRYRELLYFLGWRDILVRYKQTLIGVAWALIRPLITMTIFVFVFGKLAQLPSNGVPYPILVCTAMLPWQLFANGLQESSNSLIINSNLISKVYFPRLMIPLSTIAVNVVDFMIALILLVGMMFWYAFVPSWRIIALPLFVALALISAAGMGIWLAALNVRFRDFRYVVPFIIQLGLYLSPVGFSSSIIPEAYRSLYALNPMVGVIDGFRWSILGERTPLHSSFLLSLLMACLLLTGGIWYFRRTEQTMADIL